MTFCRTLAALALGAPLLVSTAAGGGYLGLETTVLDTTIDGTGDVRVVRLYARFDDPGDQVVVVFGSAVDPLAIGVTSGATFYQSPVGGLSSPSCVILDAFPDLAHDTYLDIGQLTQEGSSVSFSPGFPGFGPDTLFTANGSWFRVPGDPLAAAGSDLRIFLGQFAYTTVTAPTLTGTINVTTNEGGAGQTRFGETFSVGPGPGTPRPDPTDVNRDGTVDIFDLVRVILDWGVCENGCGLGCPSDVDFSGVVDVDDVVEIVMAMG